MSKNMFRTLRVLCRVRNKKTNVIHVGLLNVMSSHSFNINSHQVLL